LALPEPASPRPHEGFTVFKVLKKSKEINQREYIRNGKINQYFSNQDRIYHM